MQFILYTGVDRLFIVGCDVSASGKAVVRVHRVHPPMDISRRCLEVPLCLFQASHHTVQYPTCVNHVRTSVKSAAVLFNSNEWTIVIWTILDKGGGYSASAKKSNVVRVMVHHVHPPNRVMGRRRPP